MRTFRNNVSISLCIYTRTYKHALLSAYNSMLLHMYIQACTSTHHALAQTDRLLDTPTHPQTIMVAKSNKSNKATKILFFNLHHS